MHLMEIPLYPYEGFEFLYNYLKIFRFSGATLQKLFPWVLGFAFCIMVFSVLSILDPNASHFVVRLLWERVCMTRNTLIQTPGFGVY